MFVRYGKSVFGLRGNEGERIFVGLFVFPQVGYGGEWGDRGGGM